MNSNNNIELPTGTAMMLLMGMKQKMEQQNKQIESNGSILQSPPPINPHPYISVEVTAAAAVAPPPPPKQQQRILINF